MSFNIFSMLVSFAMIVSLYKVIMDLWTSRRPMAATLDVLQNPHLRLESQKRRLAKIVRNAVSPFRP